MSHAKENYADRKSTTQRVERDTAHDIILRSMRLVSLITYVHLPVLFSLFRKKLTRYDFLLFGVRFNIFVSFVHSSDQLKQETKEWSLE